LARRTGGSESSCWRTIQNRKTSGGEYSDPAKALARIKSGHQVNLQDQVKAQWGTPRATEYKGCGPKGSKSQIHRLNRSYLDAQVAQCWPTPRAKERSQTNSRDNHVALSKIVSGPPDTARDNTTGSRQGLWRTPSAGDGKRGVHHNPNKRAGQHSLTTQATGQLNPDWVETLMGLPLGHTDSRRSVTASSLSNWRKLSLNCLET
jgi:hypothetical protein